ncbi:MAG TPA: methyltransferase domain-containing protein [Bryobacteraceae bacterium]|nr:methyltransferase domain-containing protein [Bryobacteraceae bacterium]
MSSEFTGERVIPKQVDPNLWNEHVARYAFAARLATGRRVLDAGCGTGYGASELAKTASFASGLDVAADAVEYARTHYPRRNLAWLHSSCTALPFRDGSFDLVVAFEVIEHLKDWQSLIREARRVLAPGGQFIVSTPNKAYYGESRKLSGPNPFHEHEFEYEEFRGVLAEWFPHVGIFLEDHTEGILFQAAGSGGPAEVRLEQAQAAPDESNFFIAVCTLTPQAGPSSFVYLPSTANLLKERGTHIERLETERAMKDEWLQQARAEHAALVNRHRAQTMELEERNRWAASLDAKLAASGERIAALQEENAAVAAGYAAKVAELERDLVAATQWAEETDRRLTGEVQAAREELVRCVELLHEAEKTMEERTRWALQLDAERQQIEASRWTRLGRKLGLGPRKS